MSRSTLLKTSAFIAVLLLGGVIGFWIAVRVRKPVYVSGIRQGGYDFVNPLLVCSIDDPTNIDTDMQSVIQNVIKNETAKGDISIASVYYRKFKGGGWTTVNPDEKFFPASMGKVPLMMAYYSWAEAVDVPVLARSILYTSDRDANAQQEIVPKHPIISGKTYSVEELLAAMIKDSDNNATELLFGNIDKDVLLNVFSDLHVPYLAPNQSPKDFMGVTDFAFFFRVLYNGTYLSHVDSENALKLLSETSFDDGIVAGVPAGTPVAHKFGLASVAPTGGTITTRELHDCGIVYAPKGAYELCVMTKSNGSLHDAERGIANISAAVYEEAQK